jgi:metallophosphoesterase (TIGR00282 family)
MNVLFIGDVFGSPGRKIVQKELTCLKEEFSIDITIANGENVAHGKGITEKTASTLFDAGIDVFTSGNHLWDKRESLDYLKIEKRIIKPLNTMAKTIGHDRFFKTAPNGEKLAIVCLIGQAFMPPIDSPLNTLEKILPEIKKETNNILVDFHAEATAEKRAMGYYFDGRISALIGTHTHIQTADEEILPNGSGYITDVGMTGPHDSVIGMKKDIILEKMTTGMPQKFDVADDGLQINAIFLKIDEKTGKTLEIKRIRRKY